MTRRAARKKEVQTLQLVSANHDAMTNGPRRKTFSVHDMHPIEPLTDNQEKAFELFDDSDSAVLLEGFPGTGKSFIAIYNALKLLLDKDTPFKQIIIVRNALSVHDIGHLPGDVKQKTEVYEAPYHGIFDNIFKYKKSYENMKEAGLVRFEVVSHMRGITLDSALVILEEAQNFSFHQGLTVATRIGTNSKLIVCGDTKQSDFKKDSEKSEAINFFKLIKSMPSTQSIKFGVDDIVRSNWTKELIETQIKLGMY